MYRTFYIQLACTVGILWNMAKMLLLALADDTEFIHVHVCVCVLYFTPDRDDGEQHTFWQERNGRWGWARVVEDKKNNTSGNVCLSIYIATAVAAVVEFSLWLSWLARVTERKRERQWECEQKIAQMSGNAIFSDLFVLS